MSRPNISDYELSLDVNTSENYFCECSSNVFLDPQIPLSGIGRWRSSGQGFADTRINDTFENVVSPKVKIRRSGSALVTFENSKSGTTEIEAATFRISDQNEIRSSGVQSWFDFDPNISGRHHDLGLDLYDRAVITFEKVESPSTGNNLENTSIHFKTCEISFEESIGGAPTPSKTCDLQNLESNVITSDPFINKQLVNRIAIKPEDVDYFTYSATGSVVPIVSNCVLTLQIWGTPEVVAFRVRNEDRQYNSWCEWQPPISDNYTEIIHSLSGESGVKKICVQAMTYSGITGEFCLTVIADYVNPVFELKLYGESDYSPGSLLPVYHGSFVASTPVASDGTIANERTIYLEIRPSRAVNASIINFDVLQQGLNDQINLSATKFTDNTYRGSFVIKKEDKLLNTDGLARIRVSLPGICDGTDGEASTIESQHFSRDRFNTMYSTSRSGEREFSGDVLSKYRQPISGRVGVDIVIRPNEDPYMVFGDPDYHMKRDSVPNEGVRPAGL